MATAKKQTKPTGAKTPVVVRERSTDVIVRPATITEAPPMEGQVEIALPKELQDAQLEDAPSGLNPVVEFNRPGEWVAGTYVGERTLTIGKREQPMYDLRLTDGQVVSIWGSTILDTRMRQLLPEMGDKLLIQFLGDVPTKRGMTPAKNFRVSKIVSDIPF